MKTFRHISAQTVEEATAALRQAAGRARVIAGGTDLLGEMKDAILPEEGYPEVVVDLKSIDGLDYIREEGDTLLVGALTRLEDLAGNETVQGGYPALAQAAAKTASPHIREMGTVAGNICQNNRCWYYWTQNDLFHCLRKGGNVCYALIGDARYHSIFGAAKVEATSTGCMTGCPNSIDIPAYMASIREGDLDGAARTLLKQNPVPAVTGRVCPHTCEDQCARGEFDEPVSIREVERHVGDRVLEDPAAFYLVPQQQTGKRVAVVGSGPAGLSAAYYLRQAGHEVTVFERMPEAGGLLAYGIPAYRLPREVLRQQVQAIGATGIEFALGTTVDKDKLAELRESYDAVFVAAGAWQETEAGIAGEDCLLSATEFLRSANLEEMKDKTVGIIGGGNTAIDVARSLLRAGAKPVIYYRRSRAEMPALAEEVAKAEEEGVRFEFLTNPVGASEEEGAVELTCCRMELGEPDASGRPRPVRVEGSEFDVQCDTVLKAIVERPDYSFLPPEFVDEKGRLKIDPDTYSLGDHLYAGGDFVTGPATVAQAVSAGHRAAEAIDRQLGGTGSVEEANPGACAFGGTFSGSCLLPSSRVQPPELSVQQRVKSLNVEESGTIEAAQVQAEAARCFNCGCIAVNSSDLAPALVALGARIRTTQRVLDAEDFFAVGVNRSTTLDDCELVLELQVPRPARGATSLFSKFSLRKSIDFPLVNLAAVVENEDGVVRSARICLNSVYGTPFRVTAAEQVLSGKRLDEATAEQAAEAGLKEAFPLEKNRYKAQIARTLVKRALLACIPSTERA